MSKKEKREQKIRENVKNVSLEDFEWLINQYGYIKAGSNHSLAIIGPRTYPYPRTNPLNQNYVKGILEIIDSEADK